MRFIALVLVVAGCTSLPGPALEPDAGPGFNACDPGSPTPSGDPSCGGGGTIPTCGHTCSSKVECGGATQRCQFCNFGVCKEEAPGLRECQLACDGVEPRPTWCDFGGCPARGW